MPVSALADAAWVGAGPAAPGEETGGAGDTAADRVAVTPCSAAELRGRDAAFFAGCWHPASATTRHPVAMQAVTAVLVRRAFISVPLSLTHF